MANTRSLFGSINITDLAEAIKNKKAAVKKVQTQKGEKLFADVVIWIKDEADEFNNNASMQISFKKEFKDDPEKRPYVGNFKFMAGGATEANQNDTNAAANNLTGF